MYLVQFFQIMQFFKNNYCANESYLMTIIYNITYRGYYMVVQTYEVYLRDKINFLCSSQRVTFFYYIDVSVSKTTKNYTKNKGKTKE